MRVPVVVFVLFFDRRRTTELCPTSNARFRFKPWLVRPIRFVWARTDHGEVAEQNINELGQLIYVCRGPYGRSLSFRYPIDGVHVKRAK